LHRNLLALAVLLLVMPFFFTGDIDHALKIHAGMFGLNGIGSLDAYFTETSSMTVAFTGLALAWIALAGRINLRYYAGHKQGYLMEHVSGLSMLLLWAGFGLSLSRLAANSFSPFLYFQF
jgi:alginate O-acetyltransferase complex protein AlgI